LHDAGRKLAENEGILAQLGLDLVETAAVLLFDSGHNLVSDYRNLPMLGLISLLRFQHREGIRAGVVGFNTSAIFSLTPQLLAALVNSF
jgi:hypothetical protein